MLVDDIEKAAAGITVFPLFIKQLFGKVAR
jgi:hypothetical protein